MRRGAKLGGAYLSGDCFAAQVLGDAQDAETGQRGYSPHPRRTVPGALSGGAERADRDLALFKQRTADNPDEQRRAAKLAAMLRDRFTLSICVGGGAKRCAVSGSGQGLQSGKEGMDALRAEVAAGMAAEQALCW